MPRPEFNAPLCEALSSRNPDAVSRVLDRGADPNAVCVNAPLSKPISSQSGRSPHSNFPTPIMLAAYYFDLDTAELLLSRGADINAKSTDGETALMLASIRGYPEVVEFLIRHGANVDSRSLTGDTALTYAVESGNYQTVLVLIRHHAKVDVSNVNGYTPLSIARARNDIDIINLITKMKQLNN